MHVPGDKNIREPVYINFASVFVDKKRGDYSLFQVEWFFVCSRQRSQHFVHHGQVLAIY